MNNPRRGEIEAVISGKRFRLCLTFGALAWLEQRLGLSSLAQLGQKFSSTNLTTTELIAIIAAGLHGADENLSEADLLALPLSEHWVLVEETVARLLTASFSDDVKLELSNAT